MNGYRSCSVETQWGTRPHRMLLVTCSKKDGAGGWCAQQSERDVFGRSPQVLTFLWEQGPETRGGILVTGKVLGWRYQCMVSVKVSPSCPIIQLIYVNNYSHSTWQQGYRPGWTVVQGCREGHEGIQGTCPTIGPLLLNQWVLNRQEGA